MLTSYALPYCNTYKSRMLISYALNLIKSTWNGIRHDHLGRTTDQTFDEE